MKNDRGSPGGHSNPFECKSVAQRVAEEVCRGTENLGDEDEEESPIQVLRVFSRLDKNRKAGFVVGLQRVKEGERDRGKRVRKEGGFCAWFGQGFCE